MPIDPSMLAKSIGTLTDLHPDQDLAATLQQAVQAAKQPFDADAAGVMLVTSTAACGGPAPRISAPSLGGQPGGVRRRSCMEAFTTGRPAVMHDAYAGVVANLLGTAAKAQLRVRWPSSSRSPWIPGG
jgi:hypothetical protein